MKNIYFQLEEGGDKLHVGPKPLFLFLNLHAHAHAHAHTDSKLTNISLEAKNTICQTYTKNNLTILKPTQRKNEQK